MTDADKLVYLNYDDYNRGLYGGTINSHITKFTRGKTMKENDFVTKFCLQDKQLIMYRNKDHDPISALDIYVAKQSITNRNGIP